MKMYVHFPCPLMNWFRKLTFCTCSRSLYFLDSQLQSLTMIPDVFLVLLLNFLLYFVVQNYFSNFYIFEPIHLVSDDILHLTVTNLSSSYSWNKHTILLTYFLDRHLHLSMYGLIYESKLIILRIAIKYPTFFLKA